MKPPMEKILYPEEPVLIVDDEIKILEGFTFMLKMAGIDHIVCIQDSREVMPLLEKKSIEVILLDLTMPIVSGERFLASRSASTPLMPGRSCAEIMTLMGVSPSVDKASLPLVAQCTV